MADESRVTFKGAMAVLTAIAEEHFATTGRPLDTVVFFGGSALAAHNVRMQSGDVDLYAPNVDDEIVDRVTKQFKGTFGPDFKIDITPSNTLFGPFGLNDIEQSPIVGRISIGSHNIQVRAIDQATLYLLKFAAGRPKDQADIQLLAHSIGYDAVAARAKQILPWYGNRAEFPAFAEKLQRRMAQDFQVTLRVIAKDIALSPSVLNRIEEIRSVEIIDAFQRLKNAMRERPDLIGFNPSHPQALTFKPPRLDPDDPIALAMRRDPQQTSDLAAAVLKEKDPKRHFAWLFAIKNKGRGGRAD